MCMKYVTYFYMCTMRNMVDSFKTLRENGKEKRDCILSDANWNTKKGTKHGIRQEKDAG